MSAPTPRTNAALVGGLIDVKAGVDIDPFITAANHLTTNVCGASGYSDDGIGSLMETIERWLSAHFYTIYDNQMSQGHAGSGSMGFMHKIDYGLKNSMYGQQAMMLDYLGNLAAVQNTNEIKKKIKVGITWLGTRCLPWPYGWPDVSSEM